MTTAPVSVHLFDIRSGDHVTRIPYTSATWNDAINQSGGATVGIDYSQTAVKLDLRKHMLSWAYLVGIIDGDDNVLHAGPLTSWDWDASSRSLTMSIGGGLTLLEKRLVIDPYWKSSWRDTKILVDETHPAGHMAYTLTGSPKSIISGLVSCAVSWDALPINTGPSNGDGEMTRTYYAWDLATVADRIKEIGDLDDGPEYRFDPRIDSDGRLSFDLVVEDEIVSSTFRFNTVIPDGAAVYDGVSSNGDDMVGQMWLTGGKDDDSTLMCRRTSADMPENVMMLQGSDTQHTTVSVMSTLQQQALGDLSRMSWPEETHSLKVRNARVRPGDRVDLTVTDDFTGTRTIELRATSVAGTSDTEWLTVKAQEVT